ncbi:MAG TPA: lamin tail domain-containing protein [Bacteroidales bacterium]|nr:lamin tail domain-containing protein [Bacteroidales bacterium]
MKKTYVIFFLTFFILTFSYISYPQTVDEKFNDAELDSNPKWYGNTSNFNIITYTSSSTFPQQLLPSLRQENNGSYYISTPNKRNFSSSNTEWHFWTRVPKATSSVNSKIYIMADRQDLSDSAVNGYYVSLGLNNKRLTLYKKKGLIETPIIQGSVLSINDSYSNYFKVKIIRDSLGNWTMYSDTTNKGATDYVHYNNIEGYANLNDTTYDNSSWFGIIATNNSSSTYYFYFDNLYSGDVILDTTPPIVSIIPSKPKVKVKFNEPVDANDATNINNYCILELPAQSAILCNPDTVKPVSGEYNTYELIYNGNSLLDEKVYTLTISGIKDLEGNIMQPDTFIFAFHEPKQFDIVINEIMADPDPPVQLPNVEYIELYNRTIFPINLKNWKLSYGTSSLTTKIFPDIIMPPLSYIIISNNNALDAYGINIPMFTSSTSLTNSEATIILQTPNNKIIHAVKYSINWYRNNIKSNGGWSLEQIDSDNPCGEEANWRESENPKGGTPGQKNSVTELYSPNKDNQAPEISHIGVNELTPDRFYVYFNEPLDSNSFSNPQKFHVMLNNTNLGNPSMIKPLEPLYSSATFYMPTSYPAMQNGYTYQLIITDSIKDCSGNIITSYSTANFALPEKAEFNDIIINEILSNPPSGCTDYVEIYNKSNKVINLGNLTLATWDSINQKIDNPNNISEENFLIFPGEYYCLTTNPDVVKKFYNTTNPKGFIKLASMPSYYNDNGIVVIGNKSLQLIDKLTYTKSMHLPILSSTKGVSLERISFNLPTEDPSNWHSAASTVGYGTPAYKNSQYAEYINTTDNPFTIVPEIFSPDNDGYNDVLGIAYKFDEPGYIANIVIYDAKGRTVKSITKNAILDTQGVFTWNGMTDNNEKAPIGIYIIYSEIFDLQGKSYHYKNKAVLGGKFK